MARDALALSEFVPDRNSSRVREDAAQFAQHFLRITFNGGQHHAEIHVVQRTFAAQAADPPAHVGDFLDLDLLAWEKGNAPLIAAHVTVAVFLLVEPRITEQDADGATFAFAKAIKHDARVGFTEMFVGDVERFLRHGREAGLKADVDAAGYFGFALEAKVLLKNPEQIGGKPALGEENFPRGEGVGQVGSGNGDRTHAESLAKAAPKPIHKSSFC